MIISNKNKLYQGNEEVLIKGVSIPDVFWLKDKENQDIREVIIKIKKLGFNAVRVPILPGNFIYYKDYLTNYIKEVVILCKKNNFFCILDWHGIGNPLTKETRLKEYFHTKDNKKIYWYTSDLELAKKGIKKIAELFGNEDYVVFEIFNEPAPGEKAIPFLNLEALPWEDWRKEANNLISLIRKFSKNLIIVSSNYWTYNLKETSKNPIKNQENIAYAFHCYPLKNNKTWEEMLESMKKYPIIMTEWGYDTNKKTSTYYGNKKEYGKPLLDYCKKNNIHWVAWCFSTSWRPRLLKSWSPFELSECGELAKEQL